MSYPNDPGFKSTTTSQLAGVSMSGRAKTLRSKALDTLIDHGYLSADQIAFVLGESVLAIRPRISELKALGQVEDSGRRRLNLSGKPAIIWRLSVLQKVAA